MKRLILFAFLLCGLPAFGGPPASVSLRAPRTILLADGKQSAEIAADVRDRSGAFVPDGTEVTFDATLGTLNSRIARTTGGVARVQLTSAAVKGVAYVTAITSGAASQPLQITFTDDPADTFEGNTYIEILGADYLAYSPPHRVVEAMGKSGQARVSYRNIEINADRLQLDAAQNVVRATGNITLKRAGRTLKMQRLFYPLMGGTGYGIGDWKNGLRALIIKGDSLEAEPTPGAIPDVYLTMTDISRSPLVIVARAITYFPGEKFQFKRPKFYQDGQPILSLPYHELGLNATQLFSDQFVSVGSTGLRLDIPVYYEMSPRTVGAFRLRHNDQLGRNVYSSQSGWSLDMVHDYSSLSGRRFDGEFAISGLTRGDWGLRWRHNQQFGDVTRGSFFLETPRHESVFASANLQHQMGGLRMGAKMSSNNSLTRAAYAIFQGDFYLETLARNLGGTGLRYTLGATTSLGQTRVGSVDSRSQDTGVQLRAFSAPLRLDRQTTLMNSFSVGHLWSNRAGQGMSSAATLSLNRAFSSGANVNLTYDFLHQPTYFDVGGSHRLSASMYANIGRNLYSTVYSSWMLDAPSSSLFADLHWYMAPRWRLGVSATTTEYLASHYRDLQISLSRTIGGRDVTLSWSSLYRRFAFDLTATQF